MKRIAAFIIKRRIILLIITLIITAVCGFLATKNETNTDMTKYLADNSSMKQGMDIMDAEFPEAADEASIRVMFDDLSKTQIADVKAQLEAIPYVDTVGYEANSADYNKDNHTLFVISCDYDYGTSEELSIEQALQNDFTDYKMTYCNNDTPTKPVPLALLASALGILIVILLIMSKSWLEPVLFLATIGIAVVINMGTNVFFPYTAELTSSIAPILQLALSMDYSIILMNRYRQEKLTHDNKLDAMKEALGNSITSISSSSLTTVVGLLALVFLTFKLGPELGIILAKGVFISMLCVFIILPTLILAFDKGIEKSSKKAPNVPTGFLAKFSLKARFVLPVIFAVLIVGSAFIQNKTDITFTEGITDDISAVFPKDNAIVVLYDKEDESSIEKLIDAVEKDEHVKSAMAYKNTVGAMNNTTEMTDAILEMGDNADIDENLVKMLYYLYNDGELPQITAEEFITFIKGDVINNDTFSKYMDGEIAKNIDEIEKYASKEQLTKKMTVSEAADFFEMKSEDMQKLYLYYFTENGGIETGKITVTEFCNFVLNTVATDDAYSAMFTAESLSQLQTMQAYTDKDKMTAPLNFKQAASLLGMSENDLKMLYVYYYSSKSDYQPKGATLPDFISFMQTDVVTNPAFSAYLTESATQQLASLAPLTDKATLQAQLPPSALAQSLGIAEENVQGIMYAVGNTSGTMSISELVTLMLSNDQIKATLDEATLTNLSVMQSVIQLVINDTVLDEKQIADFIGTDEASAKLLLTYKEANGGVFDNANLMSVQQVVDYLIDNSDLFGSAMGDNLNSLKTVRNIINSAVNQTEYSAEELSAVIGMEQSQTENIYLLYRNENGNTGDWKLTPQEFVDFAVEKVLPNKDFADYFDEATSKQLTDGKTIIDAVVSEKKYSKSEMYELLSSFTDELTESSTEIMYLYYAGLNYSDKEWKMTIPQMLGFISDDVINNETYADFFDEDTKADIRRSKDELEDAVAQMNGKNYSRLILTTDYPEESAATSDFMQRLDNACGENFEKDYYLIGSSAMVFEMENSFKNEYMTITIITAIAIFLVILLAFKNFVIPLLLTLLVQCGVFITVAFTGLQGNSIYYLALLIVQSILMGATIDYAIVFSSNYREYRKTFDRLDSLKAAYSNSIHTIMTSGSIIILVTGILGMFSADEITSQVCTTISLGALIAVLLILLVLPGLLAFADRLLVKKEKHKQVK